MRHLKVVFVAGLLMAASTVMALGSGNSFTRDVEVPGDNFSLEGALELFKQSKSPEEFEQLLNNPETKVNNLDLNGDGDIDYIKVIDKHEGNVHAFILQAVVSPKEYQDVAVIELEKLPNGKAVLQIVGDEDLYGIETIIEPSEEVVVNAGTSTVRNNVDVWSWPSVQYVYGPYYTSWVSPWGWNSTPYWWSPWRPVSYVVYRPYWEPYRHYYSVCQSHRVVYARDMYLPMRQTSNIVFDRHYREIGQARATRGRDSYYNNNDQNDGSGRSRHTYSGDNDRSQHRSRNSASGGRTSSTSGRTRGDQTGILQPHERTVVHDTPDTRTHQRSVEVQRESSTPRLHTSTPQRSTQQTQPRSSSSYHPSSTPHVATRSHSYSSPTPHHTVSPSHSSGGSFHSGGGSSHSSGGSSHSSGGSSHSSGGASHSSGHSSSGHGRVN